MKKKIIIPACILLLAATYAILAALQILPFPFTGKESLSSAEEDALTIKKNRVDAMLYGADIDLNTELVRFRKLSSITPEAIKRPAKCNYSYLVINDLDGSITLSSEEIGCINEYLQTRGAAVLYLGKKYLNAWDQPDWGPPAALENVVEISVEYTNEKGRIVRGIGMWTEEDSIERPEMIHEVILNQMSFFIYMNT